jgi:hypothetical protein
MGLRGLLSERYGAEEPPWHGGGKVMSRSLTYLVATNFSDH